MTVKGIEIRNIYYMLAYAFKVLREGEYVRIAAEEFENAEDLFGEILSLGATRILKRGLHRMYETRAEEMPCVRGKISLPETIRLMSTARRDLVCLHDDFTPNNAFNQILRSTCEALVRTGKTMRSLPRLKRVLSFLADVDVVQLRQIRWAGLQYERNNAHYRMMINLCRLVVDGLLMSEDTDSGDRHIRSVEIDEDRLANLYECFLRNYYSVNFPQLNAAAKEIRWDVAEDSDASQLPKMVSDITLTDGKKTLILDAKFYGSIMQEHYEKHSYRNAHLNQMVVYAMSDSAQTGRETAAMLLYAKTGACAARRGDWRLSGFRIGTRILDLSVPFVDISNQLDQIVIDYFGVKKRMCLVRAI